MLGRTLLSDSVCVQCTRAGITSVLVATSTGVSVDTFLSGLEAHASKRRG